MTTTRTIWMVLSTKAPPNHDSGSWTRHETLSDALETLVRIKGSELFERTQTGDLDTWRKIEPERHHHDLMELQHAVMPLIENN